MTLEEATEFLRGMADMHRDRKTVERESLGLTNVGFIDHHAEALAVLAEAVLALTPREERNRP